MALVGNMISEAKGGNPSTINYIMFTAVFAMLTLFYLIPATCSEKFIGHPIIMLVLDVLNVIFFFCAAIALPAMLRVHSCSNRVWLLPVTLRCADFFLHISLSKKIKPG
jgi:hypothetical protein